jgi:N,N-dimethylformamidase
MIVPYVTGYCEKLSIKAGQAQRFMLSGEGVGEVDVQIVRLLHGDENPAGPGFVEAEVAASCNGRVAVAHRFTQAGSYIEIPDPDQRVALDHGFSVYAFVWPTTPRKGRQGILTQWSDTERRGFGLGIDARGRLALWLGDGRERAEVTAPRPLHTKLWYFVAATYDPVTQLVSLYQEPVINAYNSLLSPIVPLDHACHLTTRVSVVPLRCDSSLLFAGWHELGTHGDCVGGLYNGKIDRAGLQGRPLQRAELDALRTGSEPPPDGRLARWDPTIGYTDRGIGDRLVDTGPYGLHGTGYNRPVRAMTGYNWRGRDDCFRLAPGQYGGIYFNDDAIIDCRWPVSFEWTLPTDLESGVYAARVRGAGVEDHLTFFVRPAQATAKVAMLMPTASYLAYSNEHFVLDAPAVEAVTGHPLVLHDYDYLLGAHPEWGRSSYDHHNDGAGVCYVSYRRPIMGLRPKHRMASTGVPWQFPADLSIIWWLEQTGVPYDVLTDEDLHYDGLAALEPYKVVINGTHSEYYSEEMMDATEAYLARGGRVMYLGGNGYYWVVAFRPDEPWCMEIRKLDSGSRAWQAAPGEYYMATTGDKGGIWRNRGRPPQKLVGVGFTSEGMDRCQPYRRLPDGADRAVAWVFDGVSAEVFGDSGLALDGAGGIELDRYDRGLGTPPQTYLLATSFGHSDHYPHVGEEVMFNYPGLGGTQDFQVRADMTLFTTTHGGAVFATGSIAWGQALPSNADVARITRNVLERFLQDGGVTDT